jgi:hypothetical protein
MQRETLPRRGSRSQNRQAHIGGGRPEEQPPVPGPPLQTRDENTPRGFSDPSHSRQLRHPRQPTGPTSAPSRLNIGLVRTAVFVEPPRQQGGSHEQEVCRAAHGRGTGDLRSDHQNGNGQVGEAVVSDHL